MFLRDFKKSGITLILSISLGMVGLINPLYANPQDGVVIAGSASIDQSNPGNTIITQTTDKAVINWQGFSIGESEHTHFAQPNSSSMTLNRVTGNQASYILGQLTANGQLILLNPAGIIIGKNGKIDVAGLIASTANLSDANFMQGKLNFVQLPNQQVGIINNGSISIADRGLVALVAPSVANNGKIVANLGKVVLGSGTNYTIDLNGDNTLQFAAGTQVNKPTYDANGNVMNYGVSNAGQIFANGGKVILSANDAENLVSNAVNMEGVIEARTSRNQNGSIILSGNAGTTQVSGTLDVSGLAAGETGGTIEVLGNQVNLKSSSVLTAAGDAGGGTILVGGNYQGKGPQQNAKRTVVESGAKLNASAITSGNGGKVVVWADENTQYAGQIIATGGLLNGNGGQAEVSGKQTLQFQGLVNLSAPNGAIGALLLDPENITITNGTSTVDYNNNTFTSNVDDSILDITTLVNALANANVTIQTGSAGSQAGNITVANAITWTSGYTLTLSAANSIFVNAAITNTAGGSIVLRANNDADTATGSGINTIVFGQAGSVKATGSGKISLFYNPTTFTNPTNYSSYQASGSNALTAYMLVNNVTDLQNISTNLSGTYAQGANIDASSALNFVPLGDSTTPFSGVFNGNGYTIDHFTLSSNAYNLGLFGYSSGIITNALLTNIALQTTNINSAVGGLVGYNLGNINNSSVTGLITANSSGYKVGGLVGINDGGTITNNSSSATISSLDNINGNSVGGLIGYSTYGTINNSNFSGSIIFNDGHAGGLIGQSAHDVISNSYSTGTLTSTTDATPNAYSPRVGGLLGSADYDQITNSYTNISIDADLANPYATGGFIGESYNNVIDSSFSSGAVIGDANTGGFIGVSSYDDITNVYNTASVNGKTQGVGGLIGYAGNFSASSIVNAYNAGFVTVSNPLANKNGAFFGYQNNAGTLTNAYWNSTTSGLNSPGYASNGSAISATSLTTAQMMNLVNFNSAFNTTPWNIITGYSFPYLTSIYTSTPIAISGSLANSTVNGGEAIKLAINGINYATAGTGRDNSYYFLLANNTISNSTPALIYNSSGSNVANAIILEDAAGSSHSGIALVNNQLTLRNFDSTQSLNTNSFSTLLGNLDGTVGSANYNNFLFDTLNDGSIQIKNNASLQNYGSLIISNNIASGTGNMNLNNVNLAANITSGGNIILTDIVLGGSQAATNVTTSGNITVDGTINDNGITAHDLSLTGGRLYLNAPIGDTTPIGSLNFTSSNAGLLLSSDITAQNDITFNNNLGLLDDSNITSLLGNINFNGNAVSTFSNYLSVAANGDINLGTPSNPFSLSSSSSIGLSSTTGDINFLGQTAISGGGGVYLDSLDGDINFESSLISDAATFVLAANSINFEGAVGNQSTSINNITISDADTVNIYNQFFVQNIGSSNANTVNIFSNNNLTDNVITHAYQMLSSTGGTINIDTAANRSFNESLNFTSKPVNLITINPISINELISNKALGLSGHFTTNTGNFIFGAPVTLLGNTTLNSAASININGAINGNYALALQTASLINIGGTIGSNTPLLSFTTNGGTVNLGRSITALDGITFNSDVVVGGSNITFNNLRQGDITFNNTLLAGANITLNNINGDINFNAPITSTEQLTINNAKNVNGTAAINVDNFNQVNGTGSTTLTNLTTNNAANIRTANIYGNINAGTDANLTAANNINATVQANRNANLFAQGSIYSNMTAGLDANIIALNNIIGNFSTGHDLNLAAQNNVQTTISAGNNAVINSGRFSGNITANNVRLNSTYGTQANVVANELTLGGRSGGVVQATLQGHSGLWAVLRTRLSSDGAIGNFFVNGCLLPGGCVAPTATNSIIAAAAQAEMHHVQPATCTFKAIATQDNGLAECNSMISSKDLN